MIHDQHALCPGDRCGIRRKCFALTGPGLQDQVHRSLVRRVPDDAKGLLAVRGLRNVDNRLLPAMLEMSAVARVSATNTVMAVVGREWRQVARSVSDLILNVVW